MANYQTQVFQNEFLPDGGTDVNAIVSISVDDAGDAGSSGVAGEIIIIDCSGSMGKNTMAAARQAAMVANRQHFGRHLFCYRLGHPRCISGVPDS